MIKSHHHNIQFHKIIKINQVIILYKYINKIKKMATETKNISSPNKANNQPQSIPYFPPNKNKSNSFKNDLYYLSRPRSLNNSVLDIEQKKAEYQHEKLPNPYGQKNKSFNQNTNYLQLKNLSGTQAFRNTKHDHKHCVLNQQSFKKTTNKLMDINFSHHDTQQCVCNICTCGRHFCKLHVVKPELRINSIYRNDFHNKKPLDPLSHRPTSSKRPNANGPNLDIRTTYNKDFYTRVPGIKKLHPEDCLNIGGPAMNLTSYTSGFPGYKCDNQYVKPTFNANNNGLMPFHGTSNYQNQFNGKPGPYSDLARWTNHFKTGQPWLGNTIYREKFRQPQPHQYPQIRHIEQKLEINPDFEHQYETIYKNEFPKHQPTLCKSKIHMESKIKGVFKNSKGNFNENSDFKAMAPDYHAISTSKHSYV